MFLHFREVFREQQVRGWQIEHDDQEGFYLSKYDDVLNDDQFRFYLVQQGRYVTIRTNIRRKSTGVIRPMKPHHPQAIQADRLVAAYNFKMKRVYLA